MAKAYIGIDFGESTAGIVIDNATTGKAVEIVINQDKTDGYGSAQVTALVDVLKRHVIQEWSQLSV